MRKLPPEAFDFYFELGVARSYQTVADHFGVSKQAVVKRAKRDNWQQQLIDLEKKASERRQEKMLDSAEEMAERHRKMGRLLQARALEAIKSVPFTTAAEAARGMDLGIKFERTAMGEPTDRQALNIENILRDEVRQWVVPAERANDGWDDFGDNSVDAE